jgi:hypothetical protein
MSPLAGTEAIDAAALMTDSVWRAMAAAQLSGMAFFHPDPLTMYLRSSDSSMYATARATFAEDGKVELTLELNRGSSEQFDDLKQRIAERLSVDSGKFF